MARLHQLRWITEREQYDHYISERLGKLQQSGFLFKHPGSWGEWPQEYLDSVLAHDLSKQVLLELWGSESSKSGVADLKELTRLPEQEEAAARARAAKLSAFYANLQKGQSPKS
jgi:hypothetical protein